MPFGRPESIELLTLINRRFSRDLPIQPNYVGKIIDAVESEKIVVEWMKIQELKNFNTKIYMMIVCQLIIY